MDDVMIERCSEAIRKAIYADLDTKQAAIDCIKAMREPTQKMLDDGMWIAPAGEIVGEYGAKEVWQNMIDAITGAE